MCFQCTRMYYAKGIEMKCKTNQYQYFFKRSVCFRRVAACREHRNSGRGGCRPARRKYRENSEGEIHAIFFYKIEKAQQCRLLLEMAAEQQHLRQNPERRRSKRIWYAWFSTFKCSTVCSYLLLTAPLRSEITVHQHLSTVLDYTVRVPLLPYP